MWKTAPLCLFVALVTATAPSLVSAQSPRTISHQGLLTDTGGEPVADAARTMTFKIYNVGSGGSALWMESKSVATVNGVFSTILGSNTPITGVDFSQELWLGVAVASDAEMARTPLTGVPYALGLAMPYPDTVRIVTSDLGTDGSELANEDLTIYANDAIVGLYSDAGGAAGSGITFGQIGAGNVLQDRWSMYRKTTGAEARLRFTYGTGTYAANPIMVEFDTTGGVVADTFRYAQDHERHLTLSPLEFRPDRIYSSTDFSSGHLGAFVQGGSSALFAVARFPAGAVLQDMDCYVYDGSVSINIECSLEGASMGFDDQVDDISSIGSAVTSGLAGYDVVSTSLGNYGPLTDEKSTYFVKVTPDSGAWATVGGDLRLNMVVITYTVSTAD